MDKLKTTRPLYLKLAFNLRNDYSFNFVDFNPPLLNNLIEQELLKAGSKLVISLERRITTTVVRIGDFVSIEFR